MKSCTASKAALLAHCAYPFRDGVKWTETRGEAAIKGDNFHQAVASLVDETIPKPAVKGTKWLLDRLKHAQDWIDRNYVRGWRAEEAYAYDPETGTSTMLGHNIGRAYEQHGRKPGELAGSSDIAWINGTRVFGADWKTGRFVSDHVWFQMGWLSLFQARHYGVTEATTIVLHVTESGVNELRRDFGRDDLRRIEDDLRAQLRAVPDAWPTAGDHCDACFCPVRPDCEVYAIRRKVPA